MQEAKTQPQQSALTDVQKRLTYHVLRAESSVESILGILNTYRSVGNPDWSHVGSICDLADKLQEIVDGFSR